MMFMATAPVEKVIIEDECTGMGTCHDGRTKQLFLLFDYEYSSSKQMQETALEAHPFVLGDPEKYFQ